MPDIIDVITRKRKLILLLTLAATVLALAVSLLRPKEYLATATALPANSLTADKARVFNNNIEALYPEIGAPDELDRIEGTAKLDTIFLSVAAEHRLADYYAVPNDANALYRAASILKKKSDIRRSAYGELKVSVWDADAARSAILANALLQKLNDVHQHIQNANNAETLQVLKVGLANKLQQIESIEKEVVDFRSDDRDTSVVGEFTGKERNKSTEGLSKWYVAATLADLQKQARDYQEIIGKYELAVTTSPRVLIPVENARPAISPDRPKVLQTTLIAFGASLLFSFLLALFADSRRHKA
jgi:capsular polysaccharide biosynthesis protein